MSAARPDTWMPLYVADYLADTGHLSTRQHGAYLLLIMHYWRTGRPISTRVEHVLRLVGMTRQEWDEDGADVLALFAETPDGYVHKRIEAELLKAKAFIEQRANAGRTSAATRAQRKANETPTPVATNHPTDVQREAKTSPSPSPVVDVAATRDARETDLEKSEARKICEAFNSEVETIFTSKTHLPHATNYHTALSYVREGFTADFCRPVFVAVLARKCAAGQDPPSSLSYFAKPLANAKAAAAKPMPEGNADDDLVNIPPHLDTRKARSTGNFDAAIAAARGIVAG